MATQIARLARAGVLTVLAVLLAALTLATELGFWPEPRAARPEAAIVRSPP